MNESHLRIFSCNLSRLEIQTDYICVLFDHVRLTIDVNTTQGQDLKLQTKELAPKTLIALEVFIW